MRKVRADLQWMRLESLDNYHLLFFETGFFGTADDADRAAAAEEGGKCNLGILVRTESAAGGAALAEATTEGGEGAGGTPAMDGMGTVAWGPSSSSSSSSSGAMVERDVSGESTPSPSRSSVSSSRSLAAAAAAAFLTVVEAVEAEAVLPPEEVEMR